MVPSVALCDGPDSWGPHDNRHRQDNPGPLHHEDTIRSVGMWVEVPDEKRQSSRIWLVFFPAFRHVPPHLHVIGAARPSIPGCLDESRALYGGYIGSPSTTWSNNTVTNSALNNSAPPSAVDTIVKTLSEQRPHGIFLDSRKSISPIIGCFHKTDITGAVHNLEKRHEDKRCFRDYVVLLPTFIGRDLDKGSLLMVNLLSNSLSMSFGLSI